MKIRPLHDRVIVKRLLLSQTVLQKSQIKVKLFR